MTFDPTTLAGKALWLRAKDNAGANGSTITTWVDQSGTGHDGVAVGSPTVATAATPIGGKSVHFSGTRFTLPPLGFKPNVLTFSSQYDAGSYKAANVTDGSTGTRWAGATGTVPEWLSVEVPVGNAPVTAYTLTGYAPEIAGAPKNWTLAGSNDASAWTTLDTQNNIIFSGSTPQTFSFTNAVSYRYYRLNVTATQSPDYVRLSEFSLNTAPWNLPTGELWAVIRSTNSGEPWTFGGSGGYSQYPYFSNGFIYEDFASDTLRSAPQVLPITSWRIYRIFNDGTTWRSSLDGVTQQEATSVPAKYSDAPTVGGAPGGGFTGDIAEVLIRSQVSTAQEVTDITAYLTAEHFVAPAVGAALVAGSSLVASSVAPAVGAALVAGSSLVASSAFEAVAGAALASPATLTVAGEVTAVSGTLAAAATLTVAGEVTAVSGTLAAAATLTVAGEVTAVSDGTLAAAATLTVDAVVLTGILTPYFGEPSAILIPVELTGMMTPDLPPPVPPVDFAGIADPTVAPTLVASDTAAGNLPAGSYRYAYAAWKGSEGQPSAPSPWSTALVLTTSDTITLTYPTVAGADGYLVYREDTITAAVDVTYAVAGSVVTSVDTGQPVGAYPADGSQTDPATNVPYDPGTVLVNDPGGFPQPADGNQSLSPIITLNSTQTWAVVEEPLLRNSLVFNRPTVFGRFHQPVDWLPVNEIVATWGKIQVIIDGKDVTYFRDHPAEMGPWSSNEPNGDAATSIYFPQISWFERPNHGELAWIEGGNNVDIRLVRPNGTRLTLFEGMVVGVGHDGQGIGITVNVIGCLYQADHTPYIQELYKKNRDIGSAIADVMDGAISRRYALCNRPKTGIKTNIRGSGGARLTQAVQDLLATAFVPNATNQWTITNKAGRKPSIQLKNKTTHHWAMAMGHPGLVLNLTNDFQQMVSMVWGSGIDDHGGSWFNAKYPGIRIDDVPLYPLSVGQVFVAGDGHTGFDEFADQMRTRGYSMRSGDTYSTSDVDEVRDVQRRAGITVDGIVGAQTWTGVFGVGGSTPSLAGAHIAPLAAITQNVAYLERPDGSIIGKNPKYNKSFLAIGRLVEYGEGVTRAEGAAFARGEIRARIVNDPLWVGSATLTMDPENGSRWEIKAGQNLFVKFMYPPLSRIKVDDGLLLHISQASVTPGGEVTVQLSYLGHDMTTLAAIMRRNKDTLDPARRGANNRGSRITQDSVIPWDTEAGGGKIPLHNLQGGLWTVFRIPGGQIGSISETRYVCATGATTSSINAFTSGSALPGAKEFAVAIFGKPVTANFLRDTVGNPLTEARTWTLKAAALEKAGLIQAYGASDQPAGHWPGLGSESDPTTGKLLDGQTWPWESSSPPYLWVAEYCPSSTRVAGQLRNSPLGT
ncbi:MAG: discoidin domain-containing protein [Rhodoglobus sp.]